MSIAEGKAWNREWEANTQTTHRKQREQGGEGRPQGPPSAIYFRQQGCTSQKFHSLPGGPQVSRYLSLWGLIHSELSARPNNLIPSPLPYLPTRHGSEGFKGLSQAHPDSKSKLCNLQRFPPYVGSWHSWEKKESFLLSTTDP